MGLNYTERKELGRSLLKYLMTGYDAASMESAQFIRMQVEQFVTGGIEGVEDKESFLTFLEQALA